MIQTAPLDSLGEFIASKVLPAPDDVKKRKGVWTDRRPTGKGKLPRMNAQQFSTMD